MVSFQYPFEFLFQYQLSKRMFRIWVVLECMFPTTYWVSTLSQVSTDVIRLPFCHYLNSREPSTSVVTWDMYRMAVALTIINIFLALSIFSIVERQCRRLYRCKLKKKGIDSISSRSSQKTNLWMHGLLITSMTPTNGKLPIWHTAYTLSPIWINSLVKESVDMATVACYSNLKWERLDYLQSVLLGHRAIINADKVYVIGGTATQ